jgi:hypothetical protein
MYEARVILADRGLRKPVRTNTQLLLIVFDTARLEAINRHYAERNEEQFSLFLPAKYAVRWHRGRDDDMVVAQDLIRSREDNVKGQWFTHFSDLPYAVQALRDQYPDIDIPEQVSHVIDWPTDKSKLEPGSTLLRREDLLA